MPALDFINKTAETTADVSAGLTASTAAINLGKSALSKGEGVTVLVTEASAANFNTTNARSLRFYFEYTTDNGTIWRRAGVNDGVISAAGIPIQQLWIPVEHDIPNENFTASDIDWRITADWEEALATTDDFNFQGYLGNQDIGGRSLLLG